MPAVKVAKGDNMASVVTPAWNSNADLIDKNTGYTEAEGKKIIGREFSPIYDVDYNISLGTEDPSGIRFSPNQFTTVVNTDTFSYLGITLMKMTTVNFSAALQQKLGNGVPIDPLKNYLVSYYICNKIENQLFGCGATATGGGKNNYRYTSPNVTRVCFEVSGVSDIVLYLQQQNPLGVDTGLEAVNNVYIGGIQIEEIPELEKRMVAFMGDSTVAGASGSDDSHSATEWSKLTGAICNFGVYNRGVGGETTSQMIARWSTDMTPLASDCKYAVIQGGLNDIGQALTYQQIIDNFETMYNLAITDGFIPIVCTISPFAQTGADESKRVSVNDHLKKTYLGEIIDLDYILRSNTDSSVLDPKWVGDNVHFGLAGKKAIANAIYKQSPFDFLEPLPYFPKA